VSITTYSELVTAAQNWMARSDSGIQARIPEFITLTEDLITWGSNDPEFPIPSLRCRQMESRGTLTISSAYTSLPTDFLEPIRMKINSDPVRYLEYVTPQEFDQRYISSNTDLPKAFTIEGDYIRVGPSPDSSYTGELLYYRTIPALTVSNTTNWLLTASPGTYLYGVLFHATPYVQAAGVGVNADLISDTLYWYRGFASRVNGLNTASQASKYGGVLIPRPSISVV